MSDTIPALTDHACLVVDGPDQQGIVETIAALVARNKGNIISLDQYSTDPQEGHFFQRVVFHRDELVAAQPEIEADIARTLEPLGMRWKLWDQSVPKRMAILASKSDHCLLELLWRHRRGELPVSIPMVISNHTDVAEDVRTFNTPFFHVPSQKGTDKSESEAEILRLLDGNVDFVVLARYMQVISDDFLEKVGVPVINIHHSFLPAFIGAGPYRKAK
ncbi:MAG: formyltetrahydrofolate deformylase, partial [Microbacterium sp.]